MTSTIAIDSAVMLRRNLKHVLRSPDSMITAIALPVMLMLLFVYVFGGAINTSSEYIDYVVPGIILLCAGFGASTTAVSVSSDMKDGIIDRSEEHTSELQSLMRTSYAVFCSKKKIYKSKKIKPN